MSHEAPNASPDNSWQNTTMLFKKIAEIKPEDITNFRLAIRHNDFDIFDQLTSDKQEMLVAIYGLSEAELDTLVEQSQQYTLGLHDIDLYITTIYELTEDPRFEKFINPKE